MDVEQRGAKRARPSSGKFAYTKKSKALPKATEAQIKKVVSKQGEMKYFNSVLAATAITAATTGVVVSPNGGLFNPVQGLTIQDRVGNMAYLHTIRMKIRFYTQPQANLGGDNACTIRYALVQDLEPVPGTNGVFVDIFGTAGSAPASVLLFQALQNIGRFRVLKDEKFVIQNPNQGSTGGNNGLTVIKKINQKFFNPLKIRFNNTLGYATTCHFYFAVWCDNSDLAPEVIYSCRTCFKEE